jgi:hypothetical protein
MSEDDQTDENNRKCTRCKKTKDISFFTKGDKILKMCQTCRDIDKKSKNKRKKEPEIFMCTICNKKKDPVSFTSKDGKILKMCQHCRDNCKKSKNINKCIHGRRREDCKQHSDVLQITIKHMIGSSKQKDKKHDRYDPDNFIDKIFLEALFEEYDQYEMKCFWCDTTMEMFNYDYNDDIVSIERLDNNIGHTKKNCVLCCMTCNNKIISNKIN